eukprot:TRINITY_DN47875_c0_g1_i1.p1 TRINITY_DN47875_c0_g1~~TRINITY_DN47875_c0_g1_i1.p1  ORF type:complete len:454 (-),score=81.35 TRINITY_DN47875_c0_g1_i1:80-1441(-)
MREKDWDNIVAGFWLLVWMIMSPLLMVLGSLLMDRQEGEDGAFADALFPCPWLVMALTGLGASVWLLAASRLERGAPDMVGDGIPDAKKKTLLRVGVLGVLQAVETGLGDVAMTGLTVAVRSACDLVIPALALGAGVYLGIERHNWRRLAAVSGCAVLGGLLAVRGVIAVNSLTDLSIALVVRIVSVAKWLFAKALLESMDPLMPLPITLAQRAMTAACVLGFELTFLLQHGCYGSIFSLSDPRRVWLIILVMSICYAIWFIAELKVLRLASPMLLGFMHPFRCFVLLLVENNVTIMQGCGLGLCACAGIGYVWVRKKEATELLEQLTHETPQYMVMPEVTKTLLAAGDGRHYPSKGDQVRIRYAGTLAANGAIFDMNTIVFRVGVREVIEGWDVGLLQMSLGERAVLEVPAAYAYGRRGSPPVIPPNADLVFKVQVEAINGMEMSQHVCTQM